MSQLYYKAGNILRNLEQKKGSLKSLVFAAHDKSVDLRTQKKLYAILCKTIKHKEILCRIVSQCQLLKKEPQTLSYHLCLVLVCDLLYGKGLRCGGILKTVMKKYMKELTAAWESLNTADLNISEPVQNLPKYARINTLKCCTNDLLHDMKKEGFTMKSPEEICACSCLTLNKQCLSMKNCFCQDDLVPELLMFCCCTDLAGSRLHSESLVIIQDKASCLPAHILAPSSSAHVMDACAAPGNKTTHLSALMQNQGLIYAFDKDPRRFETLSIMLDRAGATNVDLHCMDFLTVNPDIFKDVTAILVDPSCSGSGIYGRIDYNVKESKDSRRLAKLSKFQTSVLNHALSFPGVEKVVYSTCSVHKEENEYVVRNALLKHASVFELVHVLPHWKSRGLPVFTKAECCIRASMEDKTNGFFVALFQRRQHNTPT